MSNPYLKDHFENLVRLNEERKQITDDIGEECRAAKDHNINPKALRQAVKFHLETVEKQQVRIEDETERDLILCQLGLLPDNGIDISENHGTRAAPVRDEGNVVSMGAAS